MSQGDHKDDGTCIFSYKVGGQLVFPKDKDNISEKNLYSELQQTFICTRCMPKLYVILIRKKKMLYYTVALQSILDFLFTTHGTANNFCSTTRSKQRKSTMDCEATVIDLMKPSKD